LKEFRCLSGEQKEKMAMDGSYSFFSPSPWMLGAIARRAKKIPNESTQVKLVRMGGVTETGPKLGTFTADVQYIGEDSVTVNGEKMDAVIYEIKTLDKLSM